MKNQNDQKPIEIQTIIREQIKRRNQTARLLLWKSFVRNNVVGA